MSILHLNIQPKICPFFSIIWTQHLKSIVMSQPDRLLEISPVSLADRKHIAHVRPLNLVRLPVSCQNVVTTCLLELLTCHTWHLVLINYGIEIINYLRGTLFGLCRIYACTRGNCYLPPPWNHFSTCGRPYSRKACSEQRGMVEFDRKALGHWSTWKICTSKVWTCASKNPPTHKSIDSTRKLAASPLPSRKSHMKGSWYRHQWSRELTSES
jgi:hypothetical protein